MGPGPSFGSGPRTVLAAIGAARTH